MLALAKDVLMLGVLLLPPEVIFRLNGDRLVPVHVDQEGALLAALLEAVQLIVDLHIGGRVWRAPDGRGTVLQRSLALCLIIV